MSSAQILLAYDPNNVKPGWIALGLVVVLGIATFLLWRSMNTQLGRIKAPHRADLDARGNLKKPAEPGSAAGRDAPESPEEPPTR
ncbi:MAG: hypothetical protein WAK18_14210 [Nocardioidaceae bacterium]